MDAARGLATFGFTSLRQRHRAILVALSAALCMLLAGPAAYGDQLDKVLERGELRWGADEEGGGPYVIREKGKLAGFEVELANMIAQEMGVKAVFQQGNWSEVPSLVENGTVDIALNGYELTPVRQRDYLCSRPYYVYGLQLMGHRGSEFKSWEQMNPGGFSRKLEIGVLGGTAAETYLREKYAATVNVVAFNGATDAMLKLSTGELDGALQDDCIGVFYADQYPSVNFIGRPQGGGYYAALIKPGEHRLLAAINAALTKIINDGRLEDVYDRWDLSGRAQILALSDVAEVSKAKKSNFFELMRDNGGLLLQAAGMTIVLAVISMPLAILIGMLVAVGRLYGPWPVQRVLTLYVELIRGTPLMLQLYAIFFLLPQLGILVPPMVAAIAGLAINYSAYEAEIYRAGLQAIPRGQMEAALSLGMSKGAAIRRIILPQAFRIVIPPVTNDFIALFKDTSVCSVVTVVELTKRYNILAMSTHAIIEFAIVTSILYMLMSYPLSLFARWSEKRLQTDH